MQKKKKQMKALTIKKDLNLYNYVDALLAKPTQNGDAELNAAADRVDALKAKVDAAVNPPPAV